MTRSSPRLSGVTLQPQTGDITKFTKELDVFKTVALNKFMSLQQNNLDLNQNCDSEEHHRRKVSFTRHLRFSKFFFIIYFYLNKV